MISLRKVLLTASLAVLVTGGPQVAVAEGMPMMSSPSSAEIGHVQWDWWQQGTASGQTAQCNENSTTMAVSPEVGHVAWNWWSNSHQHKDAMSQTMPAQQLSSELGNVPYQWWQRTQEQGHAMPMMEHC